MSMQNDTRESGGARGRADRGGGGGRRRLPRRPVRVVSAAPLSEHLVRIVASGALGDWETSGAGGHFKLFLPQPDGETATRTYTVRSHDPERGELTIDFALHEDGPASEFARAARPGDVFEVSGGSRPGFAPRSDSAWTVLVADQSALPAVAAVLEALPATQTAHVVIEVPSEEDVIELPSDATVTTRWIVGSGTPNERLVEAALELELPAGVGEVWVGCESAAMRTIRRHLLGDLGLDRSTVQTRGYWKQGVVAHTDHDTGDDEEGAR